jgi:hypothetical protein
LRFVATECRSLNGFSHELGQWSRPFFNEEGIQFRWAELQTSGAQLKRMAYDGFKVLVAPDQPHSRNVWRRLYVTS